MIEISWSEPTELQLAQHRVCKQAAQGREHVFHPPRQKRPLERDTPAPAPADIDRAAEPL